MTTSDDMPTVATLANAKDRLAHANFKLGRAQTDAIMSSAVARQDAVKLANATKERDEADADYRALVEKLTRLPGAEQARAAAEVRDRGIGILDADDSRRAGGLTDAQKDAIDGTTRLATGGIVEPGKRYVVGEHDVERYIPNLKPGDQATIGGLSVDTTLADAEAAASHARFGGKPVERAEEFGDLYRPTAPEAGNVLDES